MSEKDQENLEERRTSHTGETYGVLIVVEKPFSLGFRQLSDEHVLCRAEASLLVELYQYKKMFQIELSLIKNKHSKHFKTHKAPLVYNSVMSWILCKSRLRDLLQDRKRKGKEECCRLSNINIKVSKQIMETNSITNKFWYVDMSNLCSLKEICVESIKQCNKDLWNVLTRRIYWGEVTGYFKRYEIHENSCYM